MLRANHRLQFWLVYIAAWLFYAASLGTIFVIQGSRSWRTLADIASNVAPAALLGIAVVALCERLTWQHYHRRAWFFITHLALAVLYASLWGGLTLVNLSLVVTLERGRWTPVLWGSYALQWQMFTGLMAYFTIASVVYVRQIGERLQVEESRAAQAEMRAARAEAARSQAELAALRAQLNPHFLFNTLHSLMALVRADSVAAEAAIERFAKMLRYVLRAQQDETREATQDVTLAAEWMFVQNYLELERLRLGARLKVETEIDPDALQCQLPALTLQPLIENAVKHAIAPRARGGTLFITAKVDQAMLRLAVSDDGAGATQNQLETTTGLGLRLVRESLAARYGEGAMIEVETAPDAGFTVRIGVPTVTAVATINEPRTKNAKENSWSFAR